MGILRKILGDVVVAMRRKCEQRIRKQRERIAKLEEQLYVEQFRGGQVELERKALRAKLEAAQTREQYWQRIVMDYATVHGRLWVSVAAKRAAVKKLLMGGLLEPPQALELYERIGREKP